MPEKFGYLDTSYKAAGEEAGLRSLCKDFYEIMSTSQQSKKIRDMHSEDLATIEDKLTLFLSMWLGGPKTYREKYKSVGMPMAHKHLVINEEERDAWLFCMDKAVDKQNFNEDFKAYIKREFRFPAEMIRKTSKFS
jgi:hemoglobin